MKFAISKKESLENKIFFYTVFVLVIFLSFFVLRPLFSLIILALLVSSLFQRVYKWFRSKLRKTSLALSMTLVTILLSLIIPFLVITIISVGQINIFIRDLSEFAGNSEEIQEILNLENNYQSGANISNFESRLQVFINDLNKNLNNLPFIRNKNLVEISDIQKVVGDVAASAAGWIGSTALDIVKNIPVFITNIIIFIIILSTIIPNQDKLKRYIRKISPLDNRIDDLYIEKIEVMSSDMVKGTFIIAIIQGIIWGILYWISGVPYIVFWVLLSMFLSLIPQGGAIINWPIVLALFISGNYIGGIVLLLGNILIVGSSENVLRPLLVSKKAYIHPALTLIGIVGGINVFGILGFIYGPVIMILLATTIDIYVNHYRVG